MMQGDVEPSTAEHATSAGVIRAERDVEFPSQSFRELTQTETDPGAVLNRKLGPGPGRCLLGTPH